MPRELRDPFQDVGTPDGELDSNSRGSRDPVAGIEGLLAMGEPQFVGDQDDRQQKGVAEDIEGHDDDDDEYSAGEDDGQSDEGEEDNDDDQSELITVTVNGEEIDVTFEELQAGYRRHADYTRKTQELANERNQFEQERQQTQQERTQYRTLVEALGDKLKTMTGAEPDWQKLAAENPAEYVQQKAAWDHRQAQIQAAEREAERLRREDEQQQQQFYGQYIDYQKQALLSAKPELKEPEKAQEFFTGVFQYATNSLGFTPQEVQSIVDHRFILLAEKAMKFDALQKKGKQPASDAAGKRGKQTLRPGTRQTQTKRGNAIRKAQSKLRQTGNLRDAADAIEGMLG